MVGIEIINVKNVYYVALYRKSASPGIVNPQNSFLDDNCGIVTFLVLCLLLQEPCFISSPQR